MASWTPKKTCLRHKFESCRSNSCLWVTKPLQTSTRSSDIGISMHYIHDCRHQMDDRATSFRCQLSAAEATRCDALAFVPESCHSRAKDCSKMQLQKRGTGSECVRYCERGSQLCVYTSLHFNFAPQFLSRIPVFVTKRKIESALCWLKQ